MTSIAPIKPSEAVKAWNDRSIPDAVFKAFNELIVEKWYHFSFPTAKDYGYARINQKDVVDRIIELEPDITRDMIFAKKWLDIEARFQSYGWKVGYESGDSESPATFIFTAPKP